MIDNNTRFLGIDSTKVDLTKKKDELNNSVGAYYTLDEMTTLPIETTYPVTNAAEAGKRFLYKGNEWKYLTEGEIADLGYTNKIDIGFPVPVVSIYKWDGTFSAVFVLNYSKLAPFHQINLTKIYSSGVLSLASASVQHNIGPILDFDPIYSLQTKPKSINLSELEIRIIINIESYTYLENVGTSAALDLKDNMMTAETINKLFNDLPATILTATIRVTGNPGALTCDPTIATAKGYSVVV